VKIALVIRIGGIKFILLSLITEEVLIQ